MQNARCSKLATLLCGLIAAASLNSLVLAQTPQAACTYNGLVYVVQNPTRPEQPAVFGLTIGSGISFLQCGAVEPRQFAALIGQEISVTGTFKALSSTTNGFCATRLLVPLSPGGTALDPQNNLYVVDAQHDKVLQITPSGFISVVAGTGRPGFSGDGGLAAKAELYAPGALALDPAGNLYVADFGNNRIRKINAGGIISTIAGTGARGFSGDGGPAVHAELSLPGGLVSDGRGNL